MNRITIFLSHSTYDIAKVRKIRDILESIEYEPLIFYLKCLDDNNDTLEEFIKKEIESRNIFIYCKSNNSEKSVWVQKELEYIKSFQTKRLYEIDIERPLQETLIGLLISITNILKKNRVFISCSRRNDDFIIGSKIESLLINKGYCVLMYKNTNIINVDEHRESLFNITETGIFLPIISYNSISSRYCMNELEIALERHQEGMHFSIFPIFLNIDINVAYKLCPKYLSNFKGIELTSDNYDLFEDNIINSITSL